MPPSDLARRILRGEDPLDELIARLAARPESPLASYEARSNPGLLGRIGETLDIPGRIVREAFTGRPGATGRDVLGLGTNAPGLDTGDVAGFAAEVALDPLNLLGGLGTLTRAGRQAERAGKLAADLNAARRAAQGARIAGQTAEKTRQVERFKEALAKLREVRKGLLAEGAETTLRKGWRAQAGAPVPQRALLTVGLPFTEGTPLVRGAGVLGGLQRGVRAVADSGVGKVARQLFSHAGAPSPEGAEHLARAEPIFENYRQGSTTGAQEALEYRQSLERELATREAAGVAIPEHLKEERAIREALGVPERSAAAAERAIGAGRDRAAELETRYMARRTAQNQRSAQEALSRGEARASQYERAALELEKVATQGDARQRALWGEAADKLAEGRDVAGEILKRPLTPARAARVLRRQQTVWRDMDTWAGEVTGRIREAMERRGLSEFRAKTAGSAEEALKHLGAKARAEARIGDLAALVRRIEERGFRGMSRGAEEGIAEFHRVLGERAERVVRNSKQRARVLERGAGELGRLRLERRVQKLRETAAKARDRGLEGWRASLASTLTPAQEAKLRQRQAAISARAQIEATPNIQRSGGAQTILEEAKPEDVALAERMFGTGEGVVRGEIAIGGRAAESYLQRPGVTYAERNMLSQEARDALKEAGLEEDFRQHLRARTSSMAGGDLKARDEDLLDLTTDAANEYMQKRFPNLKGDWFENDYSKTAPIRFLSGRQRIETAKMVNAMAETFLHLPHVPGQTVPLEEFLAKGPLHRFRGKALSGDVGTLKRQLKEMGLEGRGIPRDVHERVFRLIEKTTVPEEVGKLIGLVDDLTKLWKVSVTLPFPGHHARNLFSNTGLQLLEDGADRSVLGEAFQRAVAAPLKGDESWLREAERIGILRGTQLSEMVDQPKGPIIGRLQERFPRLKEAGEKSKRFTQLVENFSRTWHYLSRLKAGDTAMEAARSTRRALLDYSELAPFEKMAMRRLIPFYSWTRKVMPRLLQSFVQTPRKAALGVRLTTQPTVDRGGVVPEFLRQSAAIPHPLGPDDQGSPRFIYGLGSPYEELNKLDITSPEGGVLGGLRKLGRVFGSQMNPIVKAPIELATGREFFFDRDILHSDKAEPILGAIPGVRQALDIQTEETPSGPQLRGDPYLLWALRNSPAGRATREVGAVANVAFGIDPRGNRAADLLSALTGIRSTAVSKKDRLRTMQDINRRMATRLVREGKLGQVPTQFATSLGKEDEETLGLLQEQARLRKELERLRGSDEAEIQKLLEKEQRRLLRAGGR